MLTKTAVIKTLTAKQIQLLDLNTLRQIFKIGNQETLYKLAQRLDKAEVLERLSAGKYYFAYSKKKLDDFTIANFLVQPSYISLESALSYHALIDQFPYTISSVTLKQTRERKVLGKLFAYSQINQELFWGYVKVDNYLIATPEKTVIDIIYFAHKTNRILPKKIPTGQIDQKLLLSYLQKVKGNFYKKALSQMSIV